MRSALTGDLLSFDSREKNFHTVKVLLEASAFERPSLNISIGPQSCRLSRSVLTDLRRFGVHRAIDESNILVSGGVTSLCELLAFTLCNPGDGILFSMPCYVGFKNMFEMRARYDW